jgi:protein involved in sex pheromone biosynthesis
MRRIALQSSRDAAVVLPERFRAGCAFGVARTGLPRPHDLSGQVLSRSRDHSGAIPVSSKNKYVTTIRSHSGTQISVGEFLCRSAAYASMKADRGTRLNARSKLLRTTDTARRTRDDHDESAAFSI